MAKAVPEDPYCGLAPEDRLYTGGAPDLDLYDDTYVNAEQLTDIARGMEDSMRSVDGVTNSDGAGASAGSWVISIATSHGFANHYKGSSFSASVSAIAGEGVGMERDYDYTSARHFSDLDDAKVIGLNAGNKAVKRLNPARLPSGSMPVIFDPRVSNGMLGHFAGAISGTSIARGTSFLKDHMGKQVFAKGINIIDDPLMVRGMKSRLFDGEGVTASRFNLI